MSMLPPRYNLIGSSKKKVPASKELRQARKDHDVWLASMKIKPVGKRRSRLKGVKVEMEAGRQPSLPPTSDAIPVFIPKPRVEVEDDEE